MTTKTGDGWNAGATYEDFMGRWSRPLAEAFVRWLDVPPGGCWLDVGTGTGALATAICAIARPASVVGCDPSAPFIESARQGLNDPRATFEVAGIGDLPGRAGGYDAVVSSLALNFFPEPSLAMAEQMGVARPGGSVAALVWDYADGMEFLRHFWDVAVEIEPRAGELDERRRFPICEPGALKRLLESAGAQDVRVGPVSVPTVFTGFDDYWRPFLGGTGPAPSLVASLSQEQRRDLTKELRRRLPTNSGNSIALQARAWAVVGRRAEGQRRG